MGCYAHAAASWIRGSKLIYSVGRIVLLKMNNNGPDKKKHGVFFKTDIKKVIHCLNIKGY